MKIIHTADWHIGKILHKQELQEDMNLFFDWLESYIIAEKVEVLLIAGDIFDMANPSNKDTKQYYNYLFRLSRTGVHTIITGGNHDSISLLNAPSDLLKELNITVLGGVPDEFNQQIIPIHEKDGTLKAVVLAVPFLRDKDLRPSVSADVAVDKLQIIPTAIKQHYDRLVDTARLQYGDIPLIAMGHLFMQGSLTSDSERDIHVGTLQGFEGKLLHPGIDYVALGHIHKPQRIDKQDHIRYSGSPVYLDFSEAGYEKMVIQLEWTDCSLNIQPIPIPKSRNFIRIRGTLNEARKHLLNYNNEYPLPAFVELDILEEEFSITAINEMQELSSSGGIHYKVIKSIIKFKNVHQEPQVSAWNNEHIESLTPEEILERRLYVEMMDDELKEDIRIVYRSLLEQMQD